MADAVILPYWLLLAFIFGPLLLAVPFAWQCGRREQDGEWRRRLNDWRRVTEAEIRAEFCEHYGVAPMRVITGGKDGGEAA